MKHLLSSLLIATSILVPSASFAESGYFVPSSIDDSGEYTPQRVPTHRGTGRREVLNLNKSLVRGYTVIMPMVCDADPNFVRFPQDFNGWERIQIHIEVPTDPESQATALQIANGVEVMIGTGATVDEILAGRIRQRGCVPAAARTWMEVIPF